MKTTFRKVDLTAFRKAACVPTGARYLAARALERVQLTTFERIGDAVRASNAPLAPF